MPPEPATRSAGAGSDLLHEQLAGEHPIERLLSISQQSNPVDSLVRNVKKGHLDPNPPYQRGEVWGPDRQRNLIRSLLMGLPVGAIFINERGYPHPDVVVDGKQRIEAVRAFLDGELAVPSAWFAPASLPETPPATITFPGLSERGQRMFTNGTIVQVARTGLHGPHAEQQERALFDLINYGGVPQGEQDPDSPAATTTGGNDA